MLVIVADDLVYNVLPITRHILVEQASIVEWLEWGHVRLDGIAARLTRVRMNVNTMHMVISYRVGPCGFIRVGTRKLGSSR